MFKCKNKFVYAFDTENDWNEDNTEVYLVQTSFVTPRGKQMIIHESKNCVEERLKILNKMLSLALDKSGCHYFYCANLKHESEILKEGLKVFQSIFDVTYLRRDSSMLQIEIAIDKNTRIYIRDILNNYPGSSVKSLGKLFGLPKLDGFDFKSGWSEGIDFTSVEAQEYCYRDAEIVYEAANQLHDLGFDGITLSSVAWKKCKKMLNGDNPLGRAWNKYFPKLNKEQDEFIRPAYYGGINFSNSDYEIPEEGVLIHEDASSMYPTVAIFDELPYGEPIDYGITRPRTLYICHGYFKIKPNPGKPDFLNLLHKAELIDGGYKLTLTSVDHALLYDCYEVEEEEIIKYYGFTSRVGLLKKWFIYWYNQKEESKNVKNKVWELYSKYMLNALTGRFGLRRELKDCFLLDDWTMLPRINEEGQFEENDDSYLPYVAFITAHARRRLITNSKNYSPLIHMDTDSTIGYRKRMPVSVKAMGGWCVEGNKDGNGKLIPIKRIVEGGFKRYVEEFEDGSFKIAAAGVPQKTDAEDCPFGPWIEILDNPEIIRIKGYEIGKENYVVKSEWLRKKLIKHGYNPDSMDTRKLYPKKAHGGYVYVPGIMKLNDNLMIRFNM